MNRGKFLESFTREIHALNTHNKSAQCSDIPENIPVGHRLHFLEFDVLIIFGNYIWKKSISSETAISPDSFNDKIDLNFG